MLIPFQPSPFEQVLLITILLSLLMATLYRFLTKPGEMRKIKNDVKYYKEEMTKAKSAGDTEKMNKFMSEQMKASQRIFKVNMKPMMVSMILFIVVLGWLGNQYGGFTLNVNETTDSFEYNGVEYQLSAESSAGEITSIKINGMEYSNDDIATFGEETWHLVFTETDGNDVVKFNLLVVRSPFTIPYIGSYLNWFWLYLIVILPASTLFRKLLGVE